MQLILSKDLIKVVDPDKYKIPCRSFMVVETANVTKTCLSKGVTLNFRILRLLLGEVVSAAD